MKKNMGAVDKGIRIIFVVLIAVLYFAGILSGITAMILSILALILLITSIIGICPLYIPFGISTCKKETR